MENLVANRGAARIPNYCESRCAEVQVVNGQSDWAAMKATLMANLIEGSRDRQWQKLRKVGICYYSWA